MSRPATPAVSPNPVNPAPGGPSVARILAITSRLTEILTQETEFLSTGHPREIKRFEAEKLKLTGYYRREIAALKAASANAEHSPEDLSTVRAVTDGLVLALGAHDRLLSAKRTATEGLLQAIGKEVARRDKPVECYGKDGGLRPAMPTYAATHPTTLSLDRHI